MNNPPVWSGQQVIDWGWNNMSDADRRSMVRVERKKMANVLNSLPRNNRPPTKAFDGWYELAPFQLHWELDEYLAEVPDTIHTSELPIPGARAIIAPHAGYAYSGRCSAWAFRCLDLSKAKRVFILGPSHHFYFSGLALSTFAKYSTPLGEFNVDQTVLCEIYNAIRESAEQQLQEGQRRVDVGKIPRNREMDEHSLEMETALLYKRCLETFESPDDFPSIVPMLVSGDADDEKAIGQVLLPYLRDETNAFIVSSDFCHWGRQFSDYRPYCPNKELRQMVNLSDSDPPPNPPIHETIRLLDYEAIKALESGLHNAFVGVLEETGNSVCGRNPIGAMMAALELLGADMAEHEKPRFQRVRYDRSTPLLVDPTKSSVSYVSAYAII